ncbi:MAG: tripartite tricarboxylate transporter substrate binding protein [Hyphomicrobiales bacterium]|nr:tripartite tricarboxylate transporter substrate binding protein [Hyphomicrobiales bacterium]
MSRIALAPRIAPRIATRIARGVAAIAMLALAALPVTSARAQDYPSKPVTIIIPFAAGGAGDILARILSPRLEKVFGRSFVVENKPGAGSVIAALATARAEPDGHTIMIAPSPTMAVNVTLFKKLPYDPATDFVPLAMAAQTPFVLVVNPALPVRSVAELIAWVKAQKGKVSYATAGPGVPHHLFAELLKSMTGIEMSPVPYKGSVPGITDVVAGHVPLMFVDLGPGLSSIREGRVRALGVSTAARVPALPDVPPIGETVKGFDVASWQMIVAPAKTPRPIVDRLHAELKAMLALPEVSDQIAKTGMLPMATPTVEDLQAFVRSEIARWGKVVRQAGIAGTQ